MRVYCRVRPLSKTELSKPESRTPVVKVTDEFSLVINGKNGDRNYAFDSCFGPESTQEQVFEETKRLITSAVDGFNVCIFAYGQTGSGKSHTMQGSDTNPGVTPRALEELFSLVEYMKNYTVVLKCYMVELYKDELRDLLLAKN